MTRAKLMRIFAFALPFLAAQLLAQAPETINAAKADRSYKLLREDEDWSFLKDQTRKQDFWDPIKYIQLRSGDNDWYLTIGGEAREVWQQIGNDNWGQAPYMNAVFDERYVLLFDVHVGEHVRTFVELKSGLSSFRVGGPRPIDEKRLDFQAAFVQFGTSEENANWTRLRIGRQEMHYGSGRLIDCREGPNVRLSFDGLMLQNKIASWRVDGFALRPDLDNPEFFDNAPDHATGFWGVYAARPSTDKVSLDIYYLGLDRKTATFQRGTAQEVRHSVGVRIAHPGVAEKQGWDFNYEALLQFGVFGSNNIRAWSVASENGYRFPSLRLKPRFNFRSDISSGDDPNSKTLGTFNPLFPKGEYFGVLTSTGPGPVNFIDVHPSVDTELSRGVSWSADWIFQWRENLDDGVYAVPGFLIRPADGSRARFVGNRPGTELGWQAGNHLWFKAQYGIFDAGRFLKETQPDRNLNYWALWTGYRF